jgi:hypothetical protein
MQGCNLAQGYLLAKPMSADAYLSYLNNRHADVEPPPSSANRNERTIGSLI